MWFNILKVLGTKTGFAQLDFDNVVIEDEDDCKKRWQQLCQELKEFTIPNTETKTEHDEMHYVYFINWEDSSLWLHYDYDSEIPEEVYCKALEMLFDTSLTNINEEEIGNYSINKISWVKGIETGFAYVFNHYIEIKTPSSKYCDLGFTLHAEDKSLKPIARKLLEILT